MSKARATACGDGLGLLALQMKQGGPVIDILTVVSALITCRAIASKSHRELLLYDLRNYSQSCRGNYYLDMYKPITIAGFV